MYLRFVIAAALVIAAVYAYSVIASAPVVVLNVQSYPVVGGNWTVAFNTTGSGKLAIAASNGTAYGTDLEFLELQCGDTQVKPKITRGRSIVVKGWDCRIDDCLCFDWVSDYYV